jgi:hypothetical protein
MAILNIDGVFKILHVDNSYLKDDWELGEYRGVLNEIRNNEVYKRYILGNYKKTVEVAVMLDAKGFLEVEDLTRNEKFRFIKIDYKWLGSTQK